MSQTPEASEEQFRRQVKALAEKFLRRTADQVGGFREQLAKLSQGEHSALQAVNEVAHKIHGSGAVFGFPKISEHAEQLERSTGQMLKTLSGTTAPLPAEYTQQLTSYVDELAQAVETELGILGH